MNDSQHNSNTTQQQQQQNPTSIPKFVDELFDGQLMLFTDEEGVKTQKSRDCTKNNLGCRQSKTHVITIK